MTNIELLDCDNCRMLPSLGKLPSLKHLHISNLNSVKTIDAGFYKNQDCSFVTPFPSLEYLTIENMLCLEVWSSFESDVFPLLKKLKLHDCHRLKEDLPNHLPSFESLMITNCEFLVSSLPRAPALRPLLIRESNKVELHVFSLLVESIIVEGSQMVETMIKAITIIQPTCLKSPSLMKCSSAISFPGGHLPALLKTLIVDSLQNLEFPTQHKHELLEELIIHKSCDLLTSLPLIAFPNLKSLSITMCENMESLFISASEPPISLCYVSIFYCHNFESFSKEGFPVPNLTHLEVEHCHKLKSLLDQMSTLLPNLKHLHIDRCHEIESFPERGMPPNLTLVGMANFEKLVSGLAWPSMDMLTSPTIWGSYDGIKSFPKEGFLPPSLTSLYLYFFSSLETLDCKGFLHLTSLQQLDIGECQNLQNMVGERLPVSLIKLRIFDCPLLAKRCHEKHGQIWPKISHICGKNVDYTLI